MKVVLVFLVILAPITVITTYRGVNTSYSSYPDMEAGHFLQTYQFSNVLVNLVMPNFSHYASQGMYFITDPAIYY
jgi:hypothetical protein